MARADDEKRREGGGKGGGKGSKGGGRGSGKGGGRGGGGGDDRETQISKKLSYVLRHGAVKEGLRMDERGFVGVEDILRWPPLKSKSLTLPTLKQIVASNAKQRYELILLPPLVPSVPSTSSPPESTQPSSPPSFSTTDPANLPPRDTSDPASYLIRATQGHSLPIASSSLLTPILPDDENCPEEVVHGTYPAAWKKILDSGGLSRMGRGHVHFAVGLPSKDGGGGKIDGKKCEGKTEKEEEKEVEGDGVNATPDASPIISGMRNSASVLVWVDVKGSMESCGGEGGGEEGEGEGGEDEKRVGGLKWWRSANGVVLTEGDERGFVPLRFVRRAVDRTTGTVIWENEEMGR